MVMIEMRLEISLHISKFVALNDWKIINAYNKEKSQIK